MPTSCFLYYLVFPKGVVDVVNAPLQVLRILKKGMFNPNSAQIYGDTVVRIKVQIPAAGTEVCTPCQCSPLPPDDPPLPAVLLPPSVPLPVPPPPPGVLL